MASAAWYRVNNTLDASAPSRRECHSIVVSGHRLFLFGGNDDAGRFREVHILDTGAWRCVAWHSVTWRWRGATERGGVRGVAAWALLHVYKRPVRALAA